jgi:hypothetical protein
MGFCVPEQYRRSTMAHDNTQRAPQDASHIGLKEDYEVWVSKAVLTEAARNVGQRVKAIDRYLAKHKK